MGRKRKVDNGLEPRVYESHGAYFYAHPADKAAGIKARWEPLGKDKEAANRIGRRYNDATGMDGTMVYWLRQFTEDCRRRVAAGTLSQRTLDDYAAAVGTEEDPGALAVYFAPPMTPHDVTPDQVQDFLDVGLEAKRARRANLERACLSSCFGWLLRKKHCPGLMVNPCLRASGVQRNPEKPRERYVSDAEYSEVWSVAPRSVRLLMALTYRTLQRPDSDLIHWTTSVIVTRPTGRTLEFVQNKTGQRMAIAFTPELDELLPVPSSAVVRKLRMPVVATLKSGFYTYDGISSMLRESIAVANERRRARKLEPMHSFGFRDLKGKGATDMWRAGVPIEQIQALCGHKNKTMTERYVKQRWHEAVQPNTRKVTA